MAFRTKRLSAALVPLAIVAVDRLAKWYAMAALPFGRSVVFLPGVKFAYFQNDGLVFSWFDPFTATVASLLALAVFTFYGLHKKTSFSKQKLVAFYLIGFGGASNIYDRLFYGGVADYILFARSAWNIADIMILAGIALILFKREPKGGNTKTLAQ